MKNHHITTPISMLQDTKKRRRAVLAVEMGFSIMEMLVVAVIIGVIIYALYSMFYQSQRALVNSNTQVDVMEGGRLVSEIIERELAACSPSMVYGATNLSVELVFPNAKDRDPVIQTLGTFGRRTNYLQDLFFITRVSNYWSASGFFLATATNPGVKPLMPGVSTLYKFTPTNPPVITLTTNYLRALRYEWLQPRTNEFPVPNASPLIDGVLHMSWRVYDFEGFEIPLRNDYFMISNSPYVPIYWHDQYTLPNLQNPGATNVVVKRNLVETYDLVFLSNAIPAYLEFELAVLEPRAYQRILSMPSEDARLRYLEQNAGMVHIFRKRFPLRNARK